MALSKVTPFELKRKADKKFSGKDAVCGSGKLGGTWKRDQSLFSLLLEIESRLGTEARIHQIEQRKRPRARTPPVTPVIASSRVSRCMQLGDWRAVMLWFCCFSVTATHNLGSMPSPDIYVQVTVTPHDRQSGRPSDSPRRSSKCPARESKGIVNNRHMRAKPPTNSLPNILRAKSVRTRWQGLVSTDPGVGVSIPSHFLNAHKRSRRANPISVTTA